MTVFNKILRILFGDELTGHLCHRCDNLTKHSHWEDVKERKRAIDGGLH